MIEDNIINKEANERTVLVGLVTLKQNEAKVTEYLDELDFLARTAGAIPEKRFTQKLDYPNPRTYVGKGKLEEIRLYIEDNDIGLVIFDDDLSPKQVANIERELKVKILDRTSLILDIFANVHRLPQHAHRWSWLNINICFPDSPGCGPTLNASVAVSE